MNYYEVWVSSPRYHGETPLTYASLDTIPNGSMVRVPMQRQEVIGVVVREVARPSFQTKEVTEVMYSEPLPLELLELILWLKDYYPAPMGQIISLIIPQVLASKGRPSAPTSSDAAPLDLPQLTKDQAIACSKIEHAKPKSVLLFGDTGTGKTRVYLELIKETLRNKKSAILLTPEIGLTPQLVSSVSSAFPNKTIIMHSGLTPAQRRNTWVRILKSFEPLVVIGPRSALFTPLKDIGLIVIDEFHDNAYKQEQAPHYQTTRVAARLTALHKGQLILGSATPTVADYFMFEQKKLPIVRMREQAVKAVSSEIQTVVIDLRNRQLFGRSPWISDQLLYALEINLQKKQQSLIFLNRRGTARLVLCRKCGWQESCPRCDLPLTYHGDRHVVLCHTCGFSKTAPLHCGDCGNNDIVFRSIGTKSLVSELERLLPKAKIKRFDSDTSRSESLQGQYQNIKHGNVDILVGTQVLGKGLDLPRLSVLGVIIADTSLSFPDYTSEERTFQLLNQIIGRVHRGHVQGSAFIQTYQPKHPALLQAIKKDYESFYKKQLNERNLYGFPPFRHTLKLTCSRATNASAKHASQQLAQQLKKLSGIEVIGPGPSFVEKSNGRYRWQLVVKATRRPHLLEVIKLLPANWSYDIDPANLL